MHFKAKDGKVRYCRYRAIPGDVNIKEEDESGRLTEEEQRKIWYPVIFLVAKFTDTQRSRAQNRVVFCDPFFLENEQESLFISRTADTASNGLIVRVTFMSAK